MTDFNLTERLANLRHLKGNVTFAPNYVDLVRGIWNVASWYYSPSMWKDYVFPHSFVEEFTRYFHFPLYQASYIIYIAIFITLLRYVFEKFLCKVRRWSLSIISSKLFLGLCRLARFETSEQEEVSRVSMEMSLLHLHMDI